jgi:hypothetical protein
VSKGAIMSPAELFAITGAISLLLTIGAVLLAQRDDDGDPREWV